MSSQATPASSISTALSGHFSASKRKFDNDGFVNPMPGNTIICHLPQQGPQNKLFQELMKRYKTIGKTSIGKNLILLPTSAYHMTVFNCCHQFNRNKGDWPDIPLDSTQEYCNEYLASKLVEPFKYQLPLKFKIDVDRKRPAKDLTLPIYLKPADEAEAHKIQHLRDQISQRSGIKQSDHDDYRFHISFAYFRYGNFEGEEAEKFDTYMAQLHHELAEACPIIELGPPEFCVFDDMFHFNRVLYLEPA